LKGEGDRDTPLGYVQALIDRAFEEPDEDRPVRAFPK
jgi:hypothetical protein